MRAAADPAKDQSYMLAKLDPALLDRLSFPLGGLTKDAVRQLARDAGLPVADKRESQDLCFVAGLGGRAFLQRHGGPRLRGRARSWTARAACSAATRASTTTRSASAAGSASPRPSRCTCSRRTPSTNRVVVGPRGARHHAPCLEDATAFTAPRRGRARAAALPRGADRLPGVRAGAREVLELELERPAHAVAPGQLACLMRQDRVVGEGTIGEPA